MKNTIIKLYPRVHAQTVSLYLTYTKDGKQVREPLNISYRLDDPENLIAEQLAQGEAIRSARQNEVNYRVTGLYNKARADIDFLLYAFDFADSLDSSAESNKCRQMINKLSIYAGQKIPCSMVTEVFCREFRSYLKGRLAGETAHGYFRLFKKLVKGAYREKLIPDNPADALPAIPLGSGKIKKNKLSQEELKKLFACEFSESEIVRAVRLASVTGMGDAEIRTLRARQVNVNAMEITYYRQKNKNRKVEPVTVPIENTTLMLLGDLSDPERLLFNLPIRGWVNKQLARWVKKARIDKHISFYCLRHSCIQNLMDLGVEDSVIKEIAGWSSTRMANRYARRSSKMKRDAISKLTG